MNYSSVKYKHVMECLIEQINDRILKPNDRISIKELCQTFGYNIANINLALKKLEKSEYIVKEKRGSYVIADKIPRHITGNIFVITPYVVFPETEGLDLDITPKLITALKENITNYGYNPIINITNDDKHKSLIYLEELNRGNVDGIVYMDYNNPLCSNLLKKYEENNSPIVSLDNYNSDIRIPVVTSDSKDTMERLLGEYLIPNKYEKILCVTTASLENTLKDREKSYQDAMIKNNIKPEIVYVQETGAQYGNNIDDLIADYMKRLYSTVANKKTAIIFLMPYPMRLLWQYFIKNNLPVANFCWCCFDNSCIDFPEDVKHIEIIQNTQLMAKTATEIIVNIINDNPIKNENNINYTPCSFNISKHFS